MEEPGSSDAHESSSGGEQDEALAYLLQLSEETMVFAWGSHRSWQERRRIVLAALLLGRKLEERLHQHQDEPSPEEAQRFLMYLLNDTITEFARQENLPHEEATEFLSDVNNRDLVLELNETLEAAQESGLEIEEQLRRMVEARRDRAIWSDHWSSG